LAAEVLKEAKYTITEFTMKNRKNLSEFAGLEVELPKFDLQTPDVEINQHEVPSEHQVDHDDEGAMVKADLFKLAKYSVKLFKKIEDEDQFESWVQAKITKAADYISSVYHYLEYEMKFSEYGEKLENSDVYSESQKREIRNMILEGKKQLAVIKISQANRLNNSVIREGVQHACTECGGTGMVEQPLPERTKKLVQKHKTLHNFIDKKFRDENHNGIDDRNEFEEEISPVKKPSAVADKKGNNPFAKKDDKKGGNGDAFKKVLDKEKSKPTSEESEAPKKSAPKKSAPKKDSEESKAPKKDSNDSSSEKKDSAESKPKSKVNNQDTGNPYASKKETKTDESFYEGKKAAAATMWKNVKESAKQKADKDYDGDGKIESGKDEHKGSVDKAIKASKEKECVKESIELTRLRELTLRVIR
jgi:hypothetical protein